MEKGILDLHNFLRWVILILLLISIIKSYSAWRSKRAFTKGDGKLWLFTMISAHITLLAGLYLLVWGPLGIVHTTIPEGQSIMDMPVYRFQWLFHPIAMIIAITMITLGRGMAKKGIPDEAKFRKAFVYFLLALILILAAIPWDAPMIPGMPA